MEIGNNINLVELNLDSILLKSSRKDIFPILILIEISQKLTMLTKTLSVFSMVSRRESGPAAWATPD